MSEWGVWDWYEDEFVARGFTDYAGAQTRASEIAATDSDRADDLEPRRICAHHDWVPEDDCDQCPDLPAAAIPTPAGRQWLADHPEES